MKDFYILKFGHDKAVPLETHFFVSLSDLIVYLHDWVLKSDYISVVRHSAFESVIIIDDFDVLSNS